MPCDAIVMRVAGVSLTGLYTTEAGIGQLIALLEAEMNAKTITPASMFMDLMNDNGRAFLQFPNVGAFFIMQDGSIRFPPVVDGDWERMEKITAAIKALAGKFEQARLAALLMMAMKGKGKLAPGPNGSFILKGELAL